MAVITMAAESTTLVLNGFPVLDLGEGDFLTLTPVNPSTAHANSSSGGVSIKGRIDGGVHDLVVRVQKYSDSDILLNSWRNTPAPTLINGSAKENYQRDGVESVSTYRLEHGSITAQPTDTRNNQDGNALIEYTIRFRNAVRSL